MPTSCSGQADGRGQARRTGRRALAKHGEKHVLRSLPERWNVAILVAAALFGIFFFVRGRVFLAVPCIFKSVTGIPCAGCGLTRAALALTRGEVWMALLINPLSVLVCLWAGVSWVWIAVDVVRGRDTYWPLYRRRWPRWAVVAVVVVILANWTWNIIKGL